PVRVLVHMVDLAGNESDDQIEGLILDTTAPAVESVELGLRPPADIVLPAASRATTGTTVRVAFVLNESVSDDPILSWDVDADLTRISPAGAITRVYEGVIQTPAADGPHAIQALVEDLVGNAATLEVATVVIDNVSPTAVDVDTADLVVYERHPWGTVDDGPVRLAVRVGAAAYAVDGTDNDEGRFTAYGHLLLCQDAARCGGASTLAVTALGASAEAVELTIDHDETSVWVALLDRAGNVSQPRAVRDVVYTMVSRTHPLHAHRGATTSELGPTIFEQHLVGDADDSLATGDARTLDARADARWTELPGGTPGALYAASLVYDSGADALVLFGGKNDGSTCLGAANGGNCGNTFRLNLSTPSHWSMVASTGPSPRMGAAAVYVPTTGTILLHGGRGAGSLNDTWEWSGTAWTQRTTVGPASVHHSLVFDRLRERVLMVGCTATVLRAWNDGTSTWDPVPTSGGTLPCFAADFPLFGAAYDEDADKVIAFGVGTEYVIDLATGVMTSTAMPQITSRYQPRLLWDPLRRGVLMHGGVLIAGTGSCEGSGSAHCQSVWLRKDGVWSVLDAELDVADAPHASRQL
ncbi:MAG TPA: kelch repeat-containing protein, partial [Myxococcota bacterium]|nr:kelch repeat-containing protein [Myxococcota bacterium]